MNALLFSGDEASPVRYIIRTLTEFPLTEFVETSEYAAVEVVSLLASLSRLSTTLRIAPKYIASKEAGGFR